MTPMRAIAQRLAAHGILISTFSHRPPIKHFRFEWSAGPRLTVGDHGWCVMYINPRMRAFLAEVSS